MISETAESDATPEPESPKTRRKAARKAKPVKRRAATKKVPAKDTERVIKKAEVIALMKRAKGATPAEIMAATEWQAHTVRGFVSILGNKGGEKIESSKSADGERTYKIK
jgi:hypothetical protein